MPKRHIPIKGAVLAAICIGAMMAPQSAHAVRTKIGEVEVSLDSTVRAGFQLRVEDQACDLLWDGPTAASAPLPPDPVFFKVAAAFPDTPGGFPGGNGGCRRGPLFVPDISLGNLQFVFSPITGAIVGAVPIGGTPAVTGQNADDGTLSVDSGQFISAAVSGTHELEIKWRNFGIFARGIWNYDYIYSEEESEFRPWSPAIRDDLGSEAELRDYFAYVNFNLGKVPVTVRAGPQVLNWGESTFIQGGINAFQAIDVTVLRSPGTNLREAYEAMPMVSAQIGITPTITIEGFWQWAYAETDIDPGGSYFATDDLAGPGAVGAFLNSLVDDPAFNPDTHIPLDPINSLVLGAPVIPIFVHREKDLGKDSDGQYGVAVRHYAQWLNDGTDLGFYFVNFTSRLPYLTFGAGRRPASPFFGGPNRPLTLDEACAFVAALNGAPINPFDPTGATQGLLLLNCLLEPVAAGGELAQGAFALLANETTMTYDFPADIQILGFSFSTTIGETAVSGDFAYYPDAPLARPELTEINCGNVNVAQISAELQAFIDVFGGLPNGVGGIVPLPEGGIGNQAVFGQPTSPCIDAAEGGFGEFVKAFGEENVLVGQFTTISTFRESNRITRFLGADQIAAVFNIGFMWIPDMPDPLTERPYAMSQSTSFHPDPLVAAVFVAPGATLGNEGASDPDDGFADGFSAGLTALVAPEYNNIFNTSIKATPVVALRYDFFGDSPGPIGPGFIQEQIQLNASVSFEYLTQWQLSLGYTGFFGAGFQNQRRDRDFVSGTLSYSF